MPMLRFFLDTLALQVWVARIRYSHYLLRIFEKIRCYEIVVKIVGATPQNIKKGKHMKNILFGLVLIWLLSACTIGKDFVRPTDTAFELGKTTRQEILERLGQPMGEETSKGVPKRVGEGRGVELDPKIRDATFRFYRYTFVDRTKQILLGTISPSPFKELRLGFLEDKLYFYHFVTTFDNRE
jgi:hypothetical protein